MSELNINDLPNEMIIKVLRFLDQQNLKNAILTCKRWKDIIESACLWSLELWDDIDDQPYPPDPNNVIQRMNFIQTTNRKFGTIIIRGGHFTEANPSLNIFEKHGENVVKLDLINFHSISHVKLAELFKLTPNLEHASIHSENPHSVSDVPLNQDLPELRKLSNLEIFVDDQRIVTCFRKAKLKTLTFEDNMHAEHHDALVDFLSSQKMLTSLNVKSGSKSSSILVELGKLTASIPFRLTHLKISDKIAGRSEDDHHNLLRFVKSQAGNLEELTMGKGIPISVFECVFTSMTKLNTLTVRIDQIPRENDFYEQLPQNCTVRRVKLRGYGLGDIRFIINFFKKLPNTHSLILPEVGIDENEIVFVAAQYISELESLSIRGIDEHSVGLMKFPNLKTLHIMYLCGKIDWKEFHRIHPRLTELTIDHLYADWFPINVDISAIPANIGSYGQFREIWNHFKDLPRK